MQQEGTAYSVRIYVLMMAAIGPVIAAWQFANTIDWYPWFLLFAVGVVVTLVVRSRRPNAGWVLLAIPLWVLAGGLFINTFADRSPAERHDSQVLRFESSSKGPGTVVLRDFRPGGGELKMHRNGPLAGGLSEGQEVTLVVRGGLFGWSRLEAIERRP
jgi:hypothetical protein